MSVSIDKEACTGCESCIEVCPVSALSMVDEKATVNEEECTDCGVCVDECPVEALSLE